MRWRLMVASLLLGGAGQVCAGQLVVRVGDAGGRAVADAVVLLTPTAGPAAPAPPPVTHYVDQRHEAFIPYVQVVRPGDRVVFRNSDATRHHVYSFSDAKAFEFLLRPGENSPPVTLDKAGLVAVGCNIHDHMIAYLLVTSQQALVTPSTGEVTFADLAPDSYTVQVWHPQLRPGVTQPSTKATIRADGTREQVDFALPLIPDPRGFADREHLDY
ncbi:methylamine utilization protein [Fulvimonas yonginensis]|uniref:Methylamine utilization protein n=1 Tax=Fulvimonas yonginensis TaxID=1495200 RepID=A0ABU8JEU3_9GAMM